jgi:hypothetical protein
VRLIRYAGGSDAGEDTTVLADVPIEPSTDSVRLFWNYDRNFPEHAGHLSIGLNVAPSSGAPPDGYELIVSPSELGVMIGAMNQPDVEFVVRGFLARATPEIVGAVVGQLVAHFARGAAER